MITTIDGVKKYTGNVVWFMAYSNITNSCYAAKHRVDIMDLGQDVPIYYDDKNICEEQCRMMNEKPKI